MVSRAEELRNTLNSSLKNTNALMAGNEIYESGFWSTGILPLDAVLGGGWAKGRFGLATGESATLKSLVGLKTAGKVQEAGGVAAYMDIEHSFNQEWARDCGVNVDELILLQPETGEEAIDACEVLIRQDIEYICVDSIAALLPRSERELMLSGKDNAQPARIAALMAIGLRKLNSANKKSTVLWISQMRDNIGAMAFAPKSTITGGKAKHYYVSQELMLKKIGKVYDDYEYWSGEKMVPGKQVIEQQFLAELTKSRFGQPFRQEHFTFNLNRGQIDITQYLIQQGLMEGNITKSGAWWTFTAIDKDGVVLGEHKAGSKDKFYNLVAEDDVVYNLLLQVVLDKFGLENNYS